MKSKNTIEFNGTQYDVTSGTALKSNVVAGSAPGGNIDGFFSNPRSRAVTTALQSTHVKTVQHKQEVRKVTTTVAAPVSVPMPKKSKVIKSARSSTANHVVHHKQQGTTTLMRTAVKKPAPGLKKQINVQSDLQHGMPSLIASKQSVNVVSDDRLARAKSVARSPHIAHHVAITHVPATLAPLKVVPVPVKPEATGSDAAPAPLPSNKPTDMFEHAMANASHFVDVKTHRAHFKKQTKRHLIYTGAASLALLVVAGFTAYQNIPSVQLKVASVLSGVTPTVPNFTAAGFSYNGAASGNGTVKVGFSNKSGANYELVQQNSNWDSSDLLANVSTTDASGFPTYSTLQAGNTTVYRLTNNDATWVAGGKLYQVDGTNSLSDSQVTALVKNL